MSKIKYIFIDDQAESKTIIEPLESDDLKVEFHLKEKWDEQLKFIIDNYNNFDGLLLDWQLQERTDSFNNYDAEALAQQIRRLISEGKIEKDFPIILCSAASNFKSFHEKDSTGHNIFDVILEKNDFSRITLEVSKMFLGLANGYKTLNNNISDVLNQNLDEIDIRFASTLYNEVVKGIPHEIAHFVIEELLRKEGLLISENMLSVRLGVNIEESQEAWRDILSKLSETQYKGIFFQGWERWWMPKVSKWWKTEFKNSSLRQLTANQRVERLRSIIEKEIAPLVKNEKHRSEKFWTYCVSKNIPIDPIDGLMIDGQENFFPWQERMYVSIDAVTDPNNSVERKLNPLELKRLETLKSRYHAPKRIRR